MPLVRAGFAAYEKTMFPEDIQRLAQQIVATAAERGLMAATAESCTGGLVAAALTAVPGSSAALDRGFVTYSNAAKMQMLGVPEETLSRHGAVSEATARAMAAGAVAHSRAQVSVSVTGVAGPGGGSAERPVGLVHFAAYGPSGVVHREMRFGDIGRDAVRLASVRVALDLLADRLG
nr:CinA family protein [uncultured Brevundimonas sp.]